MKISYLFLLALSVAQIQSSPLHQLRESFSDFTSDIYDDFMDGVLDTFANGLSLTCSTCKLAFRTIDSILKDEANIKKFEDVIIGICEGPIIGIDEEVCTGAVTEMGDIILPVVADSILSSDYMCAYTLELCSNPVYTPYYAQDYADALLAEKPSELDSNTYLNDLYKQIKEDPNPRDTIKLVQISDVHLDFWYEEGSIADCGGFLCCRADVGFPEDPADGAGSWGSYQCDLPHKVLPHMLRYMKEEVKPDFLVWTGDNSAHNVWGNSNEEVTEYMVNITRTIKEELDDSDVAVLPIHGNHDTWPVNVQDFSGPNLNIPLNGFAPEWVDWIGQDAVDKLLEYGYYSYSLKLKDGTPLQNSKVIGLNSQPCNNMNWYLWRDRYDPGQQIEWLEKELSDLEEVNGQAFFITHIPYRDCIHPYGMRLRAILERYQHVIRFGLSGHTHNEDIEVIRSLSDNKAIGTSHISSSLTTYTGKNPSFTLIELDAEYLIPLNYYTYYYDLTLTKDGTEPKWELLHDLVDFYEVEDASPASFLKLAEKIRDDEELALDYLWNKVRRVGERPSSCNEDCRRGIYCDSISTDEFEVYQCLGKSKEQAFMSNVLDSVFNYFADPWLKKSSH